MFRGSQEQEIEAALSYFLKDPDRQTSSSPCFAIESPKTEPGSILLYMGAILTHSDADNQVSTWLPAEQNIKLNITAIYKLNTALELFLLFRSLWLSDSHNECHLETMSPIASMPQLTPKGLGQDSCWHGNVLFERISVNWHCDHATAWQHRLCLNPSS